jgi:hypothetical protein
MLTETEPTALPKSNGLVALIAPPLPKVDLTGSEQGATR